MALVLTSSRFHEWPWVLGVLWSCIQDDVGLGSVTYASSRWLCASVVDGVDDGVDECWVTDDGLVVHEPDVYHSSGWGDLIEDVL